MADRVENVRLWDGRQILAFDCRQHGQARTASIGCGRVDQEFGWLRAYAFEIARDHHDNRIVNLSIQAVALNDDGRAHLVPAPAGVRKPYDDDITAPSHFCTP